MPASEALLNAMMDGPGAAAVVTHIGLVNEVGAEIAGGTYARQPVAWSASAAGKINPTGNLTFNIPAGVTVGGWKGFSALADGTDYGGANLPNEAFTGAGQYILNAATTGYDADPGA